MTPFEFRRRFKANVKSFPRTDEHLGLVDELLEFVTYDANLLRRFGVSNADIAYLSAAGLPRTAAPFLNFDAYSESDLAQIYTTNPKSLFPLGGSGSGDLVGIDLGTKAVVYLNHDRDNEQVFINSSVSVFVEALCLYQGFMVTKNRDVFLDALTRLDPIAAGEEGMWRAELRTA